MAEPLRDLVADHLASVGWTRVERGGIEWWLRPGLEDRPGVPLMSLHRALEHQLTVEHLREHGAQRLDGTGAGA